MRRQPRRESTELARRQPGFEALPPRAPAVGPWASVLIVCTMGLPDVFPRILVEVTGARERPNISPVQSSAWRLPNAVRAKIESLSTISFPGFLILNPGR